MKKVGIEFRESDVRNELWKVSKSFLDRERGLREKIILRRENNYIYRVFYL